MASCLRALTPTGGGREENWPEDLVEGRYLRITMLKNSASAVAHTVEFETDESK